ncbi:MAG: hypothetical protein R3Y44_01695 [Rikenellaceae bacterium]
MKRLLLLSVATLTLSSCATIFTGSKSKILIDANIPDADYVNIDGFKHYNVTFPFQTKVRRGFNETIVTAEKEGYDKTSLMIYKDFNAVSVLNLTNILGWGIDAATGAMMKPEYKGYELEFLEK